MALRMMEKTFLEKAYTAKSWSEGLQRRHQDPPCSHGPFLEACGVYACSLPVARPWVKGRH